MANTETVESALIKILDRALAISDNEICNKIPKIVEKRAEYIVDNVIKDLRKKSEQLKTEMVKRFREDIKKSLSRDMSVVANEYKQIFANLTNSTIKSGPLGPGPGPESELGKNIGESNNAQQYATTVQAFANNGKGNAAQRIEAIQPIVMYIANQEKKKPGIGSKIGGALKTVARPFVALGKMTAKITLVIVKTVIGAILTATVVLAAANPLMFIALIGAIQQLGPERVAELTVENAPLVFETVMKGIKFEGEVIAFLTKYGSEAKQFIDTCAPIVSSEGDELINMINSPEFLEATTVTSGFIQEYGPEFLDAAVNTGEFLKKFNDDPTILDSLPEIAIGFNEFGANSLKESALNGPKFLADNITELSPSLLNTVSDMGETAEDAATAAAESASAAAASLKGLASETFSRGGNKHKRNTKIRLSKKKQRKYSLTKHTKNYKKRTIKKI